MPDYPVSIKGVVLRSGQMLLLRNDRAGWELPGGRLEPDERPASRGPRRRHRGARRR